MIKFSDARKVLVLAPHTDDAEFGMGATLAKLKESGNDVYIAVMSNCEKSVPEGFDSNALKKECEAAMKSIGIEDDRLIFFNLEVRIFPSLRQEILENLIQLKRKIQPDLVFLPSSSDVHQDHKTVYEEGVRAFKFGNILGYELPWNHFEYRPGLFIELTKEELQKKVDLIKFYKTQAFRHYSGEELVYSLGKMRGIQSQSDFAESFEVIRLLA